MAWFATDLFFQHLTMCISDVKHFILLFVLWKRYKRCRIICRFTITSNSDECLDSSNAFSLLLSSTRLLIYKYFLFTMPIAVSNAMGVGSILLQLFKQRTIKYFIKYNKIPTRLRLTSSSPYRWVYENLLELLSHVHESESLISGVTGSNEKGSTTLLLAGTHSES